MNSNGNITNLNVNINDLFKRIVEATPIAIIVVTQEGEIVFANKYCEQLFGYEIDMLVGKEIETLVPEQCRERHKIYRQDYFKLPKMRSMAAGKEVFGLRIDGTEVPIEVSLTPMRTPEGLFILASIVDISERKYISTQLAEKEMGVYKLEVSNQELSQFAHMVSHDLKDPLRKINNSFNQVAKSLSTDADKAAGNVIRESTIRASVLIDDLLKYASAEDRHFEQVDCEAIYQEVMNTLEESDIKGVKISKMSLPTIVANKVSVFHLFLNVIKNAIKYRRKGVDLELEIGYRDNGTFFIKDNGIGIPKDQLQRVFQPFVRLQTKDIHSGTGLGLSICKKIVERHGGKIWIEANDIYGITVFFSFPDAKPDAKPAAKSE